MRRLIFPAILGIGGCAILLSLGTWQVQRLAWKEGILAEIEEKIAAAPVALPENPTETEDEYRTVSVTGAIGGNEVLVFAPVENLGIGYRVITTMLTGDRAILVDLGFVEQGSPAVQQSRMAEDVTVVGNILWPDDVTTSTPPPDPRTGVWYGRDVEGIAELLGTDPVMVVAREISGADFAVTPVRVSTSGIKNDHLGYAVTWYLLSVVWAAMTLYMIWRQIRRKD